MVSYVYRMPAGIPGTVNRIGANATIETMNVTPFGTTGAPTAYGVPLVIDATTGNVGNARILTSGDTAVYGILAREFPTQSSQDGLGTSTPPLSGLISVLKRGYMMVLLSGTTAAVKGGQVYVWTAAASGSHIVGGFEAASPGGSGFALTGCYFMGPADANGNTEIAFNI
jgi:hypothetical protein